MHQYDGILRRKATDNVFVGAYHKFTGAAQRAIDYETSKAQIEMFPVLDNLSSEDSNSHLIGQEAFTQIRLSRRCFLSDADLPAINEVHIAHSNCRYESDTHLVKVISAWCFRHSFE